MTSRDLRFLRVTRFLLERRGFVTEATRKLSRAAEAVEARAADVFILDGTGTPAVALNAARRIEASHPRAAVVLVADDPEVRPISNAPMLGKWGSFETLASEIERVYMRSREVPVASHARRAEGRLRRR